MQVVIQLFHLVCIVSGTFGSNVYLFSHPLSTSHLPTMFTLAKKVSPIPHKVFDVRWPLIESTKICKAPEFFEKIHFTSAFRQFSRLQNDVDNAVKHRRGSLFVFLDMFNRLVSIFLSPCSFADKIPSSLESESIALIDVYGYGCAVAHARDLKAKIAYVAPMLEASTIQALSGAPLTGYASSMIQGGTEPDLRNRLGNAIGHIVFRLFFVQLPLAKWYYPKSRGFDHFSLPTEAMVFVNGHKFVDQPLPRTNLIVEIGGFAVDHEEVVSDDQIKTFQTQYDNIVLISLGSFTTKSVPKFVVDTFVKVVQKNPKIGFIWKLKPSFIEKAPRNLLLLDGFIAQTQLLDSQNVKLFISNLGQNSFLEGLRSGVSILGIPTTGDQFLNAEKLQRIGGTILELSELTVDAMSNAIQENIKKGLKPMHQRIFDMLRHEREAGITTDGSHALSRLAKLSMAQINKFYTPKKSLSICVYWFLDWTFVTFVLMLFLAIF